jgi:uncharacterized protein YjeT (DUF2065 family)
LEEQHAYGTPRDIDTGRVLYVLAPAATRQLVSDLVLMFEGPLRFLLAILALITSAVDWLRDTIEA